MESLHIPNPMLFSGNVAENWKKFQQRFNIYRIASGAHSKDDEIQVALLLHTMGEDALEVFNSFTWENKDDENKYDKVLKKFSDYCTPKKNIVLERFHFNRAVQESNEDFDHFVTRLRNLASTCDFGEVKDSLIRDKIVIGIASNETRERLLRVAGEKELSLDTAISIGKTG